MSESEPSLFERNLTALQSRHPAFVALVRDDTVPCRCIHCTQDQPSRNVTSSQEDTRTSKDDYESFKRESHEQHSPYFPVIFGLADGEWIVDFYTRIKSRFYRLILLEPCLRRFKTVLHHRDLGSLFADPKIICLVGPAMDTLERILRANHVGVGMWGLALYVDRATQERYPALFQKTATIIRRVEDLCGENIRVQADRGKGIQRNLLRNLPFILRSESADAWENVLRNVPAVIVGAGPSLNKNINRLRDAPPGVLLISTDTALRPLMKRGIIPHILVACDPTRINLNHFEDFPSLDPMIFAFLPELYYEILAKYPFHQKRICLHDLQSNTIKQFAPFLGIRGTFQRSMNVGYCAFSLARLLGCSPIVLTGMDLAISPHGRSHAEDTANVSDVVTGGDNDKVRLTGNLETTDASIVAVDGYYGEQVMTFSYFHQTILLLEQTIADMETPVIDATEGGARKKGAMQKTLRETLADCRGASDISLRLHNLVMSPTFRIPPEIVQDLATWQKGILETQTQLEMGIHRLRQWIGSVRSSAIPSEKITSDIEVFLHRWKELLHAPALDMGIDIGLAKWRFETYRAQPPEGLTPIDLADWWYDKLSSWFTGLREDLRFFAHVYSFLLQQITIL
ncbi:MAG: DUF115 domain-containing protein [Candidatus Omnitrophota bacterium]|nr:MAG: DUF115 domain-containing protein [Candidatus Omnitrophota bacterium]